ncbi:MAG: hypothetical protein KDB61_15890, partial [Planctomycetes bacterium]|nr:hypothetical protein [Planctomycetota bacterium]
MNELNRWVERFGGALGGPTADFAALEITGVQLDSRLVRPGDLFVALPGTSGDGLAHIFDAGEKGAVALLLPESTGPVDSDLPQWRHAEPRRIAGECAS